MILFLRQKDLGLIRHEVLVRCSLVVLIHAPDQFEILKYRYASLTERLVSKEALDELVKFTLERTLPNASLDTPSEIP